MERILKPVPLTHQSWEISFYDDYTPAKKFLKVLFKPGVPLQARELSQAQSILQNQIERFGKHIFENGSVVLGGEVSVSKTNFIRLDNSNVLSSTALKEIVGQRVTDGTSTIATVVGAFDQGRDADGLSQDPHQVLFFNYNTSGQFDTGTLSTTGDGNLGLTAEIASGSVTAGITGTATNFVTVSDGIYFLDGYFALNDRQETAAYSTTGGYRDFSNPSTSVGFNVVKTTVNSVQDPSLNDPAFGFNNYNSPGSDRFKIEPTLAQIGITGSLVDPGGFVIDGATNDYIELVRVVNGTTTKRFESPTTLSWKKLLPRELLTNPETIPSIHSLSPLMNMKMFFRNRRNQVCRCAFSRQSVCKWLCL